MGQKVDEYGNIQLSVKIENNSTNILYILNQYCQFQFLTQLYKIEEGKENKEEKKWWKMESKLMGALGYHFKMEYIFGRTATLILCYLISIPTWRLLYPYYHYFCLLMRHFTSLIQSSNDFHTKCTPSKSYNSKYFVIDIIFEKASCL